MIFPCLSLFVASLAIFSHPVKAQPLPPIPIFAQTQLTSEQKQKLAEAEKLNDRVVKLYQQGKYDEAISLSQQALAIKTEVLGKKHPVIAQSLNNLALLYDSQRNYAAAEPLYQQALAIRKEMLGEKHPDTAISLNNLAGLYESQGKYNDAQSLYQQALTIKKEVLGENHISTATSLNNLAFLYVSQGNYAAAEPLYQQSLAITQKVAGKKHSATATSLNNLGALYKSQGKYGDAEFLYQQALAIRKEVLGENHPDTAQSLNNLGLLYSAQGNYAAAEPLYQQALAIAKETLGEKHPDTATFLNNLASLYESQGKYSEAEPLLKQALAIYEKALGKQHPDTATSLSNLASLYQSQGKYNDAEPLLKQALAIYEKAFGKKHPDTATSLSNLATLYKSQGNYSAAGSLYEEALVIRKETLGEKHPDTANSLNHLADLYRFQENYATAKYFLQKALEIRKETLGERHPHTANSLNNLAALYYFQKKYSDAEPIYHQVLGIVKEALGTNHPTTATSLNNLAALYKSQGNYSIATSFYEKALAITKEALGERHPDTSLTLNNLASLRWATGDIPQTLALLKQGTGIEEINLTIFLNQIGDENRKQAYIKTLTGTTDATISLHLNSAPTDPDAADLALTTILRRKGRVLDALSNTVALLRQRLNPSIQITFDDLSAKRSQLASLSFRGPSAQPLYAFKLQLDTLNQQIQTLETQLSRQSAEFRTENQPITVAAVQKLLPQDSALLEYIVYQSYDPKTNKWGKPRYAAYILQPNRQPRGIDLGDAAEIDQLIADWLQTLNKVPSKTLAFQRREEKAQKAAGALLEAKIIAPLRLYIKNAQHLLIAPDSQLNLIPFAALPNGAEGKYLIEDYQLTFLTSGRDLLKLQNPVPPRSPSLVMGNPDYGAEAPVKLGDENRSADIGKLNAFCCNALPGTQAEVDGIRPLFPNANIYTGKDAGIDKLEPIKAPSILHLATHGFFLPDNPPPEPAAKALTGSLQETLKPDLSDNPLLRSGLAFTGFNPKDNKYGGALTALEATTLDLWGTKLVVLSACQTGVGDVRTGEGVYGLRRAFVLAGAESQVISLWNVSDIGTQVLMVHYYANLKKGMGRSEALRQVQLAMLQGGAYPNPYYWAAFIPSGDWRSFKLE